MTLFAIALIACAVGADNSQTPDWTPEDRAFFLHGSMSTECVPESVLRAFMQAFPEILPAESLEKHGAIPDTSFGWPIGFTRARPSHLGGLPSIGINCAACHVSQLAVTEGHPPLQVLGAPSTFDPEFFFGGIVACGFKAGAAPAEMRKFLIAYFAECDPERDPAKRADHIRAFEKTWNAQEPKIAAAMAADPTGARSAGAGGLNSLAPGELTLQASALPDGADLAALSASMLKLFHNTRAALHVPDQAPSTAPPSSGPGRNDAFGLLSAALFRTPQPFAPVKFGILWNLKDRHWVHWDGNTRSPIGRNMLASLGLGAPLVGTHAALDFAAIERHTALTQKIRPPAYPFPIDRPAAQRGAVLYAAHCAACHEGGDGDRRLHSPAEIGTDPLRATLFTADQADRFNTFLASIETEGFRSPAEPGLRSTGKYWAPDLGGAWARAPYLHNGSVPSMQALLTAPARRPAKFQCGATSYDTSAMGYSGGTFTLDTTIAGNSNSGHDYGTSLSDSEKHDLIEYLKSR